MRKIGLWLLFCTLCFGHEEVYEFCAFFAENANEYSLHPISNNDLISKSFEASRTQERDPLIYFKFNAPSDSVDSLVGGCAMLSGPPIVDFNFHLNNASKQLEAHYGKLLNGEVELYKKPSMKKKTKPFKFKINGKCKEQLIIAEYCVDKEEKRLYKDKDLDYLPKFMFSGIEQNWCNCQKYEEQVSTYIKTSDNKRLKVERFLDKGCDEYILSDFVNVPEIQLFKDSVYKLLVESQAEILIDSTITQRKFDFSIKINGNCK